MVACDVILLLIDHITTYKSETESTLRANKRRVDVNLNITSPDYIMRFFVCADTIAMMKFINCR